MIILCQRDIHLIMSAHSSNFVISLLRCDSHFRCISWGPDPEGINGVFLGKDVPLQAGIMLEAVIKAVTPKIMTWGQYAEAAWFMYNKKVLKNPTYKRYVPDYTKCVNHFALHAGEFGEKLRHC